VTRLLADQSLWRETSNGHHAESSFAPVSASLPS
jgi:hypothetical protein